MTPQQSCFRLLLQTRLTTAKGVKGIEWQQVTSIIGFQVNADSHTLNQRCGTAQAAEQEQMQVPICTP